MTTILHDRKHGTFSLEGRRGVYARHEVAAQERDAAAFALRALELVEAVRDGSYGRDLDALLERYGCAGPHDTELARSLQDVAPHKRREMLAGLEQIGRWQQAMEAQDEARSAWI